VSCCHTLEDGIKKKFPEFDVDIKVSPIHRF
jgi:hypothetical protein